MQKIIELWDYNNSYVVKQAALHGFKPIGVADKNKDYGNKLIFLGDEAGLEHWNPIIAEEALPVSLWYLKANAYRNPHFKLHK